jgi:aspartate aminotransferase-like enzyme
MRSQNLRTPGPTPLPPAVREALARDMVAHRGPEFAAVLDECVRGLKWAFQTEHDMVILTASGSGGLESLVPNTLSAGEPLLAVSIGYFGDRLTNVARTYGVDVDALRIEDGQAADPNAIVERLRARPDINTVFVTHNETSTGVLNPLREIAQAVRSVRPEALLLVDGISSVGSVEVQPEAWGLDVVVAGSQKGWMIPPGLSFVSVSPRAWERNKQARLPRMYLDWQLHRKAASEGSTPWTPAVSLFYALQAALPLMRAEGLENIFARHRRHGELARQALSNLGLGLLADPRHASPTVTTAHLPPQVDARALLQRIHDRHDVVLAGGQGRLDGKIVRIGHLGWLTDDDITRAVRALQVELDASAGRSRPAA